MTWSSKQFYSQYEHPSMQREAAVVREVLNGNVPNWMFKFVKLPNGVEVTPDYLSIGNDEDFVRTPLTPYAAQYLADKLEYQLPTPRLVDEIYADADIKMLPQPTDWYKHDSLMRLGSNYIVHNEIIESQLNEHIVFRGDMLIAGHKKDVVSTPLLAEHPHKVAIYGWHNIQPLFLGHDWLYCDYSHGIRFVKNAPAELAGKCCLTDMPVGFADEVGK